MANLNVNKNIKSKGKLCRLSNIKFKNASYFIDDKCYLNNSVEFSKSFHVVYPNELQLKRENHGLHVTFHDLYITILCGI